MNIIYNAPINKTGYGIASINILKELYKIESNINYFGIGPTSVDNKTDYDFMQKIMSKQLFDIDAVYIKIWHQFDLAQRIGRGKYFAFPFFELDTFNDMEKNHMLVPDHMIVTSEWAKTILENNGVKKPCSVVPLGVDTKIFDHKQYTKLDNSKYIFLNIGKWEIRKGHDFLYEIFDKAFPHEKDVELWILASETTNSYSTKEQLKEWKNKYASSRIKLFDGVDSHANIAHIISQSDCGIYPSRAEGWNLELLESMAMNKPVIATNYSAHTEFCDKNNSYLVNIDSIEPAHDKKAFFGQGNWAKIGQNQKDQIIEYMRYVYKNRINTNKYGIETAQKYSWSNSANTLYRCITQ